MSKPLSAVKQAKFFFFYWRIDIEKVIWVHCIVNCLIWTDGYSTSYLGEACKHNQTWVSCRVLCNQVKATRLLFTKDSFLYRNTGFLCSLVCSFLVPSGISIRKNAHTGLGHPPRGEQQIANAFHRKLLELKLVTGKWFFMKDEDEKRASFVYGERMRPWGGKVHWRVVLLCTVSWYISRDPTANAECSLQTDLLSLILSPNHEEAFLKLVCGCLPMRMWTTPTASQMYVSTVSIPPYHWSWLSVCTGAAFFLLLGPSFHIRPCSQGRGQCACCARRGPWHTPRQSQTALSPPARTESLDWFFPHLNDEERVGDVVE